MPISPSIVLIDTAKYMIVFPLAMVVMDLLRAPADMRRILLKRGVLASVIAIALAKIGGALYYDPRPFAAHHFTPILSHAADNGFPSDHTLLAFTCVFLLFSQLSITETILAGLAAMLVAFSRVRIGLHSPLDIAGSILFAAIAVGVSVIMFPSPWSQKGRERNEEQYNTFPEKT